MNIIYFLLNIIFSLIYFQTHKSCNFNATTFGDELTNWIFDLATSWPAVLGDEMTRATSWPVIDSNGHFQKIMSIFFNSHLKRQQIRSTYHIKTIFVLDSIDFKSYVSPCTSFQKISCCQLPHCDWLREILTANHSQRRHSRCMLIMRLHKCTWRSAWI